MKVKIDSIKLRDGVLNVHGWAIGKNKDTPIDYKLLDEAKNSLDFELVKRRRDDVSQIYFGAVSDRDFGFDINFDYNENKKYLLIISAGSKERKIVLDEKNIEKYQSSKYRRLEKLKDLCNGETVKVAFSFLKKHGLKAMLHKSMSKLKGLDDDYIYNEWFEKTRPSKEEIAAQREHKFEKEPKISIVIPLYKTDDNLLKELIESVLNQTYANFELCFADGSLEGFDKETILKAYAQKEERIVYKILGENLGIADNTNEALKLATGDYVAFCDHDDILPEYALYEVVKAINENPNADFIYSDEDKIDIAGKTVFEPQFKPDFNKDMLRSVNYICHLLVVKKDLLEKLKGFDKAYDGAQDYDFILRASEQAKQIVHIPKVLYHWRCHMNSTASNPESKLYAFEAGERAIKAHFQRTEPGLSIESIEKGIDYGIYHTSFNIKEELISVIIPNKDHSEDLDKAIRSLLKGSYKELEIIIVENNSTGKETFAYYENIQKEFSNIRVVVWEREFNYSAINNFGVKYAKGEYLLFLNNDVELKNLNSVKEMFYFMQREDVGICGCRLLYEDDTIQHAGVVIGFGGIAGHTFIGLHETQNSYCHRAMIAQDYSAVTAACMMSKKSIFESVGGFSEELAVAFNDIDYCMKVRALGKLVVYTPYAVLYHYESKSRGLEDTPEKVERFNREIATFMKKWGDILENGDPYYNPNLTLRKSNFALRDLLKERIGEPYHIEGIEKYM